MCKILMNNKNLYNEKIVELFYIISLKEKILNVKIALCKLLKKVLSNDKSPLNEELSIHKLCKILLNKKNKTIENILKSLEIKETSEEIFNEYKNKYSDKDKIFTGNNKYFIVEFKIDYEEEKNEDFDERISHEEEKLNKNKNKNYNEIIYSERKGNDIYSSTQNLIKNDNNANNIQTKENLNNNKNESENNSEIKLNINQKKNKSMNNNSIDKENRINNINSSEEKENKKDS